MENFITASQIKQEYEKGRRNFDEIKSTNQDFHGFVLKGSSFRKADLSWSHFDTADLSDCDFTEANLIWTGMRRVIVRNTKFVKANISYADMSNSIFENTDFSNANLTATLLFNVNMGGANIQGANMTWAATSILQLDEEGLKFVLEKLQQAGREIPPELLSHLKFTVRQIHEKSKQLSEMKLAYITPGMARKEGAAYGPNIATLERDIATLYEQFEGLYTRAVKYGSGVKGKGSTSPQYTRQR